MATSSSLLKSILIIWVPLLLCIGLLVWKLIQLNTHIETSFDHIVAQSKLSNIINFQHATTSTAASHIHNQSSSNIHTTHTGSIFSLTAEDNTNNNDNNAHQAMTTKKEPIRIAYIFAGSVRSFICPHVHWSLRFNAIDALGGEAYTFIRVSTEDNRNTKTGKGVVWTPKYTEDNILETLKILNPRKLEYFSLSTQEEEMKKNFPSEIHTVFRENDLRRYSMYYHRCMGYRLAMDYEQEHHIRFDWVALIRLDAAWLEPIFPIEYYANDRVWLTETGYVAFNDQFMLIPRQYSDYIYDLNTKVNESVYCLGGPDVETWKCNRTQLIEKGIGEQKINQTLQHCCADVFDTNVLGFSETIHYRHLLQGKIPVSLARFPVYITRYFDYCLPDCDRLHYNFKMYGFEALQYKYPYFAPMSALDTRAQVISSTDTDQCFVMTNKVSLYKPMKATKYHEEIDQGKYKALNYSENLYTQWDRLPTELRFNQHLFHPWKIHPSQNVEGCLSVSETLKIGWDVCKNHARYKGGRRYHPRQTFYLIIQPHTYTMLQNPLLLAANHAQQSFLIDKQSSWKEHFPRMTRIMYPGHIPRWYNLNGKLYCFTTNWNSYTIELSICVDRYEENPNQWFQLIEGETAGNHPLTTVGMIRSAVRSKYCIVRGNVQDVEETTMPKSDSGLTLAGCSPQTSPPGYRYFEFEIIQP